MAARDVATPARSPMKMLGPMALKKEIIKTNLFEIRQFEKEGIVVE